MSIIHRFPNWGFLLALLISITSIAFANLPPASHPNALFTTTTDTHPLLHHLSPTAQLLLPSTPEFTAFLTANNETERWSTSPVNSPPPPSLIVIPATESDISATIRYANAHDLPFLASTGGHGTTMWLATMSRGGVLIYMRSLTKLEVVERRSHPRHNSRPDSDADSDHDDDDDDDYDGKGDGGRSGMTAILGGGLLAGEVVDQLWALGLQTTTGVCGCVSYSGPALGGGHGLLQGRYGLAADQVVSARVVLGDGEVVEVSEEENGDLFWALRGAGHNFGVVSEWRVRVYPVEEGRRVWVWEKFVFKGDRLEELYELANELMDRQPEELIFWTFWGRDLEIDPVKPVMQLLVIYNGPIEEARQYSGPVHALGPVSYTSGVTDYPGTMHLLLSDANDPNCQPQGTAFFRGIDVIRYEIPALRNWFDIFSDMLATEEAFAGSICLLEGYSVQGVQAVPAESTAFPHREQRLLLSPIIWYDVVGNSTLDEEAQRWSKAMEIAAFGSSEWRTYVNYGFGDETLQALYGYEPWRLQKLRGLKREYDPENGFRFYAPLAQRDGLEHAY